MIRDWDDAYANRAHVPEADSIIRKWYDEAGKLREQLLAAGRAEIDLAYGTEARQKLDLFLPEGKPKGLAIFIHGGYWKSLDKFSASHLARGALARGWAMAVPGYTLCPEIRISGITREITRAVEFAADRVAGPLAIAGHSAGGHLAARMACVNAPLRQEVRSRIRSVLSISGVHDLRPLMRTRMNQTLNLDVFESEIESPALLIPVAGIRMACWAGKQERPEFLRQNALLANIWTGLGADISAHEAEGRNHFTIVADLADPDSAMTGRWLDA